MSVSNLCWVTENLVIKSLNDNLDLILTQESTSHAKITIIRAQLIALWIKPAGHSQKVG